MDPLINVEETPGKTVGRRRVKSGFNYGMQVQESGAALQKALGVHFIPKGVYRFHSHEEADEWLTTMMARAAAKRN